MYSPNQDGGGGGYYHRKIGVARSSSCTNFGLERGGGGALIFENCVDCVLNEIFSDCSLSMGVGGGWRKSTFFEKNIQGPLSMRTKNFAAPSMLPHNFLTPIGKIFVIYTSWKVVRKGYSIWKIRVGWVGELFGRLSPHVLNSGAPLPPYLNIWDAPSPLYFNFRPWRRYRKCLKIP